MNTFAHRRPAAVLVLAALCLPSAAVLAETVPRAVPQRHTLIVVEDRGGVPAQPYYDDLGLPPQRTEGGLPLSATPPPPMQHGEAALLPVRSTRLSPGAVDARPLDAQGLTPFFLVGDDPRSRTWLRQRQDQLRSLRAAGLVVNVESQQALDALRSLAPGLALFPASGDDLARRLGLRHYPALLTATRIEQ
ncbi:integrating conjugative element protein [Xanthomonas phaseoli]|uniref:integrating conjugative element protein n=1 Tax=Xanthomonas phaseoli TaxID=1985254 RepID=UPI001237F8FF|nr:integrating conjugative element protein [Xanthomonas phaseoli]MBO9831230.1 integrating conjugative element protein [Xanthomonas phaseoli pv. dieffenbachiae]MBO9837565.1 integrating conjugative element protein [Xanthomonas phaseoli pv. dieffenbachiae]MBO9839195.1 integrating conjugative element protein [Xanthomonas phaseoli pv. dieffenbachiae]MBO9861200.1 integrating conjugative element protein [Xanthomonas phaseoli pv. dieffenbachiae]MBO9865076.1 integrating conjugative element protein [Xan